MPGSTDGDPEKFMPVRKVNGEWPYLPSGMDRDDPYAQMGRTGKFEKNGLTLETEPGRMAYVLTEPESGHFVAFNPFSEPTLWKLTLPGGAVVTANGRLAMTRMEFDEKANVLTVDYGDTVGADQQGDLASAIVIQGDVPTPKVIFNGEEVAPQEGTLDGKKSSAFPIDPAFDAKKLEERWKGAQGAFARVGEEFDPAKKQIVDWWFVGPMTEEQLAESPQAAAGDVDLGAQYATTDGDGEWKTVTGAAFGETGAITMGSRFEKSPTPDGSLRVCDDAGRFGGRSGRIGHDRRERRAGRVGQRRQDHGIRDERNGLPRHESRLRKFEKGRERDPDANTKGATAGSFTSVWPTSTASRWTISPWTCRSGGEVLSAD